jgi:hypothetical protein
MSMSQATLVGYAVGGAFLNLAFWDMPYYLYAAIVVTRYVVERAIAEEERAPGVEQRRSERERIPAMSDATPETQV